MRTVIHHGRHSIHRHKGVGSHVEVHFHGERDDEWSGIYRFGSHGMSVDDFHAHVSKVKAYHHAKMRRLNGFRDLKMRDIIVGGRKFRIVDATLSERGTDVELKLGVYLIGALGHQTLEMKVERGDLIYPSIGDVPDDDAIVAIVRNRLEVLAHYSGKHAAFVEAVS